MLIICNGIQNDHLRHLSRGEYHIGVQPVSLVIVPKPVYRGDAQDATKKHALRPVISPSDHPVLFVENVITFYRWDVKCVESVTTEQSGKDKVY